MKGAGNGGTAGGGPRQLRRQCLACLRGLEVPRPFDLDVFCRRVAARRGRELYLHPLPGGLAAKAGFCGLWIATGAGDHILYEQGASPLHQCHIIVHELAHMLLGHKGSPLAAGAAELLPDMDPGSVARVLGRSGCDSPEERAAEMMAGMVLADAGRAWAPPESVAARLTTALGPLRSLRGG